MLWTLVIATAISFRPSRSSEIPTLVTPVKVHRVRETGSALQVVTVVANGDVIPDHGASPRSRVTQAEMQAIVGAHKSEFLMMQLTEDMHGSEFLGEFRLGSQKTPVKLILDTASSFLWIKSPFCKQEGCSPENVFDHTNSTSFQRDPAELEEWMEVDVKFGTGALRGKLGKDILCASDGDLCSATPVALIEHMEGTEFSLPGVSGILGLALPQMLPSAVRDRFGLPWFYNVIREKALRQQEITFYLKKSDQTGAVFWGDAPESLLEDGKMHKFPVKDPFYYSLELTAFYIGSCCISLSTGQGCDGHTFPASKSAFQQQCLSTRTALMNTEIIPAHESEPQWLIADTGTTYNTLPGKAFESLRHLGLLTKSSDCATVSGTKYPFPSMKYCIATDHTSHECIEVKPDDYLVEDTNNHCAAAFMKIDTPPARPHRALIGQIFMRSFLTSFQAVCDDNCDIAENVDCCQAFVGIGRSRQDVDQDEIMRLR